MKRAALTLPDAEWRTRAGLAELLAALDADAGATRYVGGAVRDTLLGLPVQDVDLATRLWPGDVAARVVKAGLKAVPTGIAHGTVTAVLPGWHVEVTTLRRDVTTDGRRATVAFADDWEQDAARRDFTINALYADPATGEVHDWFGGGDDLAARRVRFIGDPLVRIAEDHLRILRFFRFHARFGRGEPDAAGLAACASRANDLMALSRERIADELLKLLGLPDPAATVSLMLESGVLAPVLPEIDAGSLARLRLLLQREAEAGAPPEALRRLIALLPAPSAETVAARLKLSNAQRKRIGQAHLAIPPEEALYRFGRHSAEDRLLLGEGDPARWSGLAARERPILPITGGALIARGLSAGPEVAAALQAVERRWIGEGFPDEARVSALADEEVAQALRATKKS